MNKEELYALLEELIKIDENEWIEFKKDYVDPQEIGEYISALSNSACLHRKDYGYLVFGVNGKTKKIIGTKFKPKKAKKGNELIENWLSVCLNPRIDFEILEFFYNRCPIVIFKIDSAKRMPTRFNGCAYIRIGSYKKKLSDYPEKERKIWEITSGYAFEKGIALNNVNEDEVLRILDYPSYFRLMDLKLPSNKEEILKKFEEEKIIIRKNGNSYDITNLGAILFATNLDDFEKLSRKAIRVIFYKGKDKTRTIKEYTTKKGYANGFQGLFEYIKEQLPQSEEIKKALRKDVKMYPDVVIRELIPNALIHQDFEQEGTSPMIEIFEDRIEISNAGAPLISVLRFIDHSPRSRNEKLAAFMRRLNICEERGSGIDKVIFAVELYQLPAPNFLADEDSIKVVVYSSRKLKQMDKEDKIRACYQHCVIKYIVNDSMTNESLRNRLNISKKNYPIASRIISNTIKSKLIKPQKGLKYVPFWAS